MSSSDSDQSRLSKVTEAVDPADIREQLARILSTHGFTQSPRSSAFLKFVVEETLADRSQFIKSRTIAIAVFGRDPSQNPDDDPIVRIQAGRLRKRLSQYYATDGASDAIMIFIPTGSYVPVFEKNTRCSVKPEIASPRENALPRIGVLPLVNLGNSPEHNYFADGLAQEISTSLARFQELAVIAYWTTSQFRADSRDPLGAGQQLEADFLVCGSIARSSNRVRIHIECVHVTTGSQVWSERFDRSLTTRALFDIQDQIVEQVVAGIGGYYGSVAQSMFEASRGKQVSELTAYEAVLANNYYLRRLDKDTHRRTREALERAVNLEPDYALANAMLGALYCDTHAYELSSLDAPLTKAESCARRAIASDPKCQHTHYLSALLGTLTQDHRRIVGACDNIIRLNPNATFMVGATSIWLGVAGEFGEAMQLFEHSIKLNPCFPGWFHFLPWLRAFTEGDYERAMDAANLFNMPSFFWDPLLRAATLGKLDRIPEAKAAYAELIALFPRFTERPEFYVGCYVHDVETQTHLFMGLQAASTA